MAEVYDRIGQTYALTRQPDRRIAAAVDAALGSVGSVANIGAGTGSYEPLTTVVAVEPSQVMIDQRPPGTAPAVRANAERLPLRDHCVDAAMALMTVHHWHDLEAGIAEMKRIARDRLVFFTWQAEVTREFWLLKDYLPAAADVDGRHAVPVERLVGLLGATATVETVLVPHDCTDGFGAAYWRRPEAYLDPTVRAGMSFLARMDDADLLPGLDRLAADLVSGRWQERHAHLLDRESLEVGYRIVSAQV